MKFFNEVDSIINSYSFLPKLLYSVMLNIGDIKNSLGLNGEYNS